MQPVRHGCAIFGGTFDPVHYGHLRSAVEVRQALQLERIKLIPSFTPPHRGRPGSTPAHRLEMLRIATRDVDFIEVDDREIRREGKSYTIETLRSVREEIGNELPLIMVIGMDAFKLLDAWRDWRQLTDHAHLAILSRPGDEDENLSMDLANFSKERFVDNPLCLHSEPRGMMCRLRLTQLEISSTRLREIFSRGESPDFLLPGEVVDYIRAHRLYSAASQ